MLFLKFIISFSVLITTLSFSVTKTVWLAKFCLSITAQQFFVIAFSLDLFELSSSDLQILNVINH